MRQVLLLALRASRQGQVIAKLMREEVGTAARLERLQLRR